MDCRPSEPMELNAVRDQINRVLISRTFANKPQLRKLLDVLCQNMGSQSALSHDQVIKELWPDEIRTKRSTDVATEINRLRRALEAYYETEGKDDPFAITLPNRSAQSTEKRWIVATPRKQGGNDSPDTRQNLRLSPRTIAVAITFCLLVALAIVLIRITTKHSRPWSGRLEGTTLEILDKDNKLLWSKSFPEGFWADYYSKGVAQRLVFEDLQQDSHANVLFLYHPASNPRSHSTTLICYSDSGQELWRWSLGRALPELEGSPPTFRILNLAVLRPKGDQPPRLVVSGYHDPSYPHQIAILDSDGRLLSEYWHSGHLDHLTLADLDGDGRQEIVATGISNGYRQGTLIVLDPDRMVGASIEQARPEVQLHGMGTGQEKIRLLFPRSDLNKALYVYNGGEESTIDHGRVRVSVRECFLMDSCVIWYEFDKDFHLVSAMADDQFRSAHTQFYINIKDVHPFSKEEEAEFQKVRCLVGCQSQYAVERNP